jgi:hypothetical protein
MNRPKATIEEITKLTSRLIELSLCNDQNFPSSRTIGTAVDISVGSDIAYTAALKNVSYVEIYDALLGARAYNVRMVDGALIQMSYSFQEDSLLRHRLAFFPSPDLTEFQNSPEIYEEDEIYAEVLSKNVVPFPIRFDFASSDDLFVELHHPRSHVTLGQYTNCRIPVSAPLAPSAFVDFVLRSFYNTAHRKFCEQFPKCQFFFEQTIAQREVEVLHLRVPAQGEVRSSELTTASA